METVKQIKQISLSRPEDGTSSLSSSIQVEGIPTLTLADKGYTRNTGKISKKESRNIAAKNTSMKDWLTPSRRIQIPFTAEMYRKKEVDEISYMDVEEPDYERVSRLNKAKSLQHSGMIERMCSALIMETVEMIPSRALVGFLLEEMIKESTWIGRASNIWTEIMEDDRMKRWLDKVISELRLEKRRETSRKQEEGRRVRLLRKKAAEEIWSRKIGHVRDVDKVVATMLQWYPYQEFSDARLSWQFMEVLEHKEMATDMMDNVELAPVVLDLDIEAAAWKELNDIDVEEWAEE